MIYMKNIFLSDMAMFNALLGCLAVKRNILELVQIDMSPLPLSI